MTLKLPLLLARRIGLFVLAFSAVVFAQSEPGTAEPVLKQVTVQTLTELVDRLDSDDRNENHEALLLQFEQDIEVLRETDPTNSWLPFFRAKKLAVNGNLGDAVMLLRRFVESPTGRSEWRAHLLLGNLLVSGFPQLASASYREAGSLKPNEPRTLIGLAQCMQKLGKLKEATTLAIQAIRVAPSPANRVLLAQLHQIQRNWDEAIDEMDQALTTEKESIGQQFPLRRQLDELIRFHKVLIRILQDAVNDPLATQKGQRYVSLAQAIHDHAEYGRKRTLYDELDILAQGIEAFESNPPVMLLEKYAIALAAVGRTDEAIIALEEVLQKDSANQRAKDWLSKLESSTP